jgi:hypothetical protein
MFNSSKIIYIVALPDEDLRGQSFFQGFTFANLDAMEFYLKSLRLPQNIFELSTEKDIVIGHRIQGIGTLNVVPLNVNFLTQFAAASMTPFVCIFSNKSTFEVVDRLVTSQKIKFLHVSSVNSASALPLGRLSLEAIFKHVHQVIEDLKQNGIIAYTDYVEMIRKKRKWPTQALGLKRRNHMCTLPNESVFDSFGYNLKKFQLLVSTRNDEYIRAMIASGNVIKAERKRLKKKVKQILPSVTEVILTSTSLFRHCYNQLEVNDSGDYHIAKTVKQFLAAFSKQYKFSIDTTGEEVVQQMENPVWQYLLSVRQKELQIYTLGLSIKACSNFAPVLRLPPAVNTLYPDLARLAGCARGDSPHKKFKCNKIFKQIQLILSEAVDSKYIDFISDAAGHVKVVSNAPLEWLPVKGLPLMIRRSVTKIPSTPGNLFFAQITNNFQVAIPATSLNEILIVRSFSDNDILRKTLTFAAETFNKVSSQTALKLTFVDITNRDSLIKALNDFSGAIMIYDGHGSHPKESDVGGLVVGGNLINVWELKNHVRVPPIVMLSACDAHPIDASHATTANGFLTLGALTVLSTVLPVSGLESARFFGRLVYRIAEFVPLYTNTIDRPMRWNQVISGMQRMVYMTELIAHIDKTLKITITDEIKRKVGVQANAFINSNNEAWYELTLECLSKEINVEANVILERLDGTPMFSDSLKYIQLGNPENIVISNKSLDDILAS